MKPSNRVFFALLMSAMVFSITASCKYSIDSYATTDAMIVTEAAFIAQITTDCEDSPSSLFAEVEGQLVVAANTGENKYQVRTRDVYLTLIHIHIFHTNIPCV